MIDFKFRRRDLLKAAAAGAALTAVPPLRAFGQSAPAVLRGTPKGEVVVWNFQGTKGEDDWQMPFFTQFEKDTGYTVKFLLRPWDKQREDLLAGMAGGQLPDIFKGHSKLVGEFGAAGVLQPLDELDGWQDYSSQFVPEFVNQLNYKGRPYGVPYSTGAFILIGNKKLMQASGIEVPENLRGLQGRCHCRYGQGPRRIRVRCAWRR